MRPQLGGAGVTVAEMEGAESQMTNSRGSSGCEIFTNIFSFFSYSVLTSVWPSVVAFAWAAKSAPRVTPKCPIPSARLFPVPLGCHHVAASPQLKQLRLFWACDSTCICCGTTGSREKPASAPTPHAPAGKWRLNSGLK